MLLNFRNTQKFSAWEYIKKSKKSCRVDNYGKWYVELTGMLKNNCFCIKLYVPMIWIVN